MSFHLFTMDNKRIEYFVLLGYWLLNYFFCKRLWDFLNKFWKNEWYLDVIFNKKFQVWVLKQSLILSFVPSFKVWNKKWEFLHITYVMTPFYYKVISRFYFIIIVRNIFWGREWYWVKITKEIIIKYKFVKWVSNS